MGEYDRVIGDFTKVIELQSNAAGHLLSLHYQMRGLAYEKTHNTDLAIADFRRALALSPDRRRAKEGLRRLGAAPG